MQLHRSAAPFSALLLLALLIGCGGDDPATPPDTSNDLVIGAAGGTLVAADGDVTLVFPAGAVSTETTVVVTAASSHPADDGFVPGTCFEFGPDGAVFSEPVSLTIAYDAADLPMDVDAATLGLCKVVGDAWSPIAGSTVDTAAGAVTAAISGFSRYGLVGVPAGGEVHEGDFFLNNEDAYTECLAYTSITGELKITAHYAAEIELPNLLTVGGRLYILGNPSYDQPLTRVSLPALRSVGGFLQVEGTTQLTELELPLCTSAASLRIESNTLLADLDGLDGLTTLNPADLDNYGWIGLIWNDALEDVDGLAGIGHAGAVTLDHCTALTSLAGLGGISSVDRGFEVDHCDSLRTLAGLALTRVGGELQIWNNPNLLDLTGLDALHTVDGAVQICYCPTLMDLDGLGSLQSVGGLHLEYDYALDSLDGLGPIASTGTGNLHIERCDNLETLAGLEHLQSVGNHLKLIHLGALTNIDALSILTHVGNDLVIENNYILQDLDGLESVIHAWGFISIQENHDLTSASALLGLQVNPETDYVCRSFTARNNCDWAPCVGNDIFEAIVEDFGGEAYVEYDVTIEGNGDG